MAALVLEREPQAAADFGAAGSSPAGVPLDADSLDMIEALTRDDLFRLGLLHSTPDEGGQGPDYVAAHKWFNLAAALGSQPAKAYRDELGLEMEPSDVTRAQREAREWMREHRARLAA